MEEDLNAEQKKNWKLKLVKEIEDLKIIQKVLLRKKPTYPFMFKTIENAQYDMANVLLYLENKNPYLTIFNFPYFSNRNVAMNLAFLRELHIAYEEGLIVIITQKRFSVKLTSVERVKGIINDIKAKMVDTTVIDCELHKVENLAGRNPSFNDYLNTVLNSIPTLNPSFIKFSRIYFDGLSIVRNKVSHSFSAITEEEKKKLINAKLGKMIDSKGKTLQMTFEGYKPLLLDCIHFFDSLFSYL